MNKQYLVKTKPCIMLPHGTTMMKEHRVVVSSDFEMLNNKHLLITCLIKKHPDCQMVMLVQWHLFARAEFIYF